MSEVMSDQAVEYSATQKRVFTRWVNMHLRKRGCKIEDLQTGFGDGLMLLQLLMQLTGESIKIPARKPKIRIQRSANLGAALKFITSQTYTDPAGRKQNIKLVNIGSGDILDGNMRIILGLTFTLILRVQIDDIAIADKRGLLLWAQKSLEPYPVTVKNLTKSWNDGRAFAGLVCRYRPDILKWEDVPQDDARAATELAFESAKRAGIEQLMDVDDVVTPVPDEKSVFTQLLQYFLVLAKDAAKTQAAEKIAAYARYLYLARTLGDKYVELARAFRAWAEPTPGTIGAIAPANKSLDSARAAVRALQAWQSANKVQRYRQKSATVQAWHALQGHVSSHRLPAYVPPEGLSLEDIEGLWSSVVAAESAKSTELDAAVKAAEDALCHAFAQAAAGYMIWARGPKKALRQVLDAATGSATERLPRAQALLEQVEREGGPRLKAAVDAQKACDAAGLWANPRTDKTLADVEAQHRGLVGQATAAVSQLSTLTKHDSLCRAFARAAASFTIWAQKPKQQLRETQDPAKGSVEERLQRARALLAKVKKQGGDQVKIATAAQKACDDAGVRGNRFTDATLGDVNGQFRSLVTRAQATEYQLAKLVEQDAKAKAFAAAAEAFMAWSYEPKEELGRVQDATKGTVAERLTRARRLRETVENEGVTQKQPVVDAQRACDDAGASGNRFTDTTLADVEAQYQSLVSRSRAAVAQLETLADQDTKAHAFAQAADAYMAWYDAKRAAYREALNALSRSRKLKALKGGLSMGASLLAVAEAADQAATESGVVVNPATDLQLDTLKAMHQTLAASIDSALERAGHEAEQVAKKQAFAQAARAFMANVKASTAALQGAAEVSGIGDAVTELREASGRIEDAKSQAESSGEPLYEAAMAAGRALADAGLTGEPLTTESSETLELAWAELQHLGAMLLTKTRQALDEARRLAKSEAEKRSEVRKAFDSFDKDKNGKLTLDEFKGALKALGEAFRDDDAAKVFSSLDKDQSGTLEFSEFLDYMAQRDSGGFDYQSMLTAFRTVAGDDKATKVPASALRGPLTAEAVEVVDKVLFADGAGELDIVKWCGEQFGAH